PEDRRVQPGVKCRGREYLRIVYGPDYTEPENLDRLRGRSLGRKRSLAMREHALGVEALDRLTGGEPLWRGHQAVFAVLARGSGPADPRLGPGGRERAARLPERSGVVVREGAGRAGAVNGPAPWERLGSCQVVKSMWNTPGGRW